MVKVAIACTVIVSGRAMRLLAINMHTMTLTLSKYAKYAVVASIAVALLLLSPVAFAHDNKRDDRQERKSERTDGLRAWFNTHLHGKGKLDHSSVTVGTVVSINGSVFIIDPVGKKSTTTVSTNSSTVFKAKGATTSLSALEVGSKVFLFGTTTASSDTSASFSASLVKIIGEGLGHLRFWHWFR